MQSLKFFFSIILATATLIYSQRSAPAPTVEEYNRKTVLDSKAAPDSTVRTPSPPSITTNAAPAVLEELEEELILEGGEESLLPASAQEKAAKVDSVTGDSASDSSSLAKTTDTLANDSTAAPVAQQPTAVPLLTTPQVAEAAPVALKIEQAQSIDFAKNFKEYRSPKVAILLSLLVPGTGQAYARNYLKTAIFGAVEATMITVGALFRYQGSKKWDDAKQFADEHYSIDKYKDYYSILAANFADSLPSIFPIDSNANAFIKQAENKEEGYYNDIRDGVNTFVHGWDDATPGFDSDFGILTSSDDKRQYFIDEARPYFVYSIDEQGDTSLYSQAGFSENQQIYNDQLSEANLRYRWSQTMFTLLLINHIASAVDAGITAKAHNDHLLGKKTVWQRINIRDQYVQTPIGTAQGLALEVRF